MTETAHPKLDVAERLIKRFVFDPVFTVELELLFANATWLAWPPMRQIVEGVAGLLEERFYRGFKKVVDVSALPFINAAHEQKFNSEFTRLMLLGDSLGPDSEAFKQEEEKAHESFVDFARYNATK